jgi:hypothetical protein
VSPLPGPRNDRTSLALPFRGKPPPCIALASSRKTAKLEFGLSPKEIAMGNRDKQKKEKKKPKKTPVPKLTV